MLFISYTGIYIYIYIANYIFVKKHDIIIFLYSKIINMYTVSTFSVMFEYF